MIIARKKRKLCATRALLRIVSRVRLAMPQHAQ
jgi:hypothetical protein